jgi:hypothetical protein
MNEKGAFDRALRSAKKNDVEARVSEGRNKLQRTRVIQLRCAEDVVDW